MSEGPHALLLGSWLIVDITSFSVKFKRMLEYQCNIVDFGGSKLYYLTKCQESKKCE